MSGAIPLRASLAAPHNGRAGKYLTFRLGKERFAMSIAAIREIMYAQQITAVPRTPRWVKGVIEQHGRRIPILDLRQRFGLPEIDPTNRTRIIVVDYSGSGRAGRIGIIVDGVLEAADLADADIQETRADEERGKLPFVRGVARVKGRMKTVLDVGRVLSGQEWTEVARMLV